VYPVDWVLGAPQAPQARQWGLRPRRGLGKEGVHMKLGRFALLTAVLVAGALWVGSALCQEAEKPKGNPQEEMEAAWMKAAAPGAQQKYLEALAGKWQMSGKSWMDPAMEPMTWGGTSTNEMIMGGRFLRENVISEMMGQPFIGLGFMGYNNVTGKYWYAWVDDMSTGLFTSEGTGDEKGMVFTLIGDYDDPMTGTKQKTKTVVTIVDQNKHTYTSYVIGPKGEETKSMEITYVRQ
jgi:hypothetical protein